MRVFVAGATGAIGRRLVPLLLADGHQVTGMTRSPERAQALRALGAEPVVADALDAQAVLARGRAAAPRRVIHQLTAIPPRHRSAQDRADFALNDRLRSEGTRISSRPRRRRRRADPRPEHRVRLRAGAARHRAREQDPLTSTRPAPFRRSAGALARARAHGPRRRRTGAALRLLLRPGQRDLARPARSARRSPAGACRSSAGAAACGRSSTSRTPRAQP